MREIDGWLSTMEAAHEVGMTPEWVRTQITSGRLRATCWQPGGRRTFRIRVEDWDEFRAQYSQETDDPDWE